MHGTACQVRQQPPQEAPASKRVRGEQRLRILAIVRDFPGTTKSDLLTRLDVAWSTLCYHVDVLEANGLLRVLTDGNATRLYLPQQDSVKAAFRRTLADPTALQIALSVSSARQATISGIVEATGLSRKVVRTRLKWLLAAQVIENIGTRHPRFRTLQSTAAISRATA